jgi:transposase
MKNIAYLGIDYHLKTLTIAIMIEGQDQFHDVIKMDNEDKLITKYLKKLAKDFEIKACYEASFSGYSFKRKMDAWGYHCDVIAPSLIPKKKGDRRKNDKRDAMELARLYASGLLTIVHAPTGYEESVRNVIRCRMAFKDSEKRTKNQTNSFLLAQGISWGHIKWTNRHRNWLSKLQMPEKYLQVTFEEYIGHLSYLETRIKALDDQIEEIAKTDIYAPSVIKLRAFRGIGTLTAMSLIAEITDFSVVSPMQGR